MFKLQQGGMSDNTLQTIDAEIASLEEMLSQTPEFRRLQDLKGFRQIHLDYTEAFLATLGGKAHAAPSVGLGNAAPEPRINQEEEMHKSERASPTDLIIEVSCKVIGECNRPMAITDLHNELTKRGIVVGGREPQRNLSTKLSGSDQIYNEKSLGWWLTSRKSEIHQKAEDPANGMAGPSQPNLVRN
jgi:hypothetical protein